MAQRQAAQQSYFILKWFNSQFEILLKIILLLLAVSNIWAYIKSIDTNQGREIMKTSIKYMNKFNRMANNSACIVMANNAVKINSDDWIEYTFKDGSTITVAYSGEMFAN